MSTIRELVLHDRKLPIGKKTYVVGVLNITPDSLGGGFHNDKKGAIQHALRLVQEGADIIEIGGESTRPNFNRLTDQEVLLRIKDILPEIIKNVDVPVSIDTYKSKIAQFALESGVHIVNDVSGLRADPDMVKIIKDYDAGVIICRDRESIDRFDKEKKYFGTSIFAIEQILKENFLFALDYGIDRKKIIIDPRMGSGLTKKNQLLSTSDCIEIIQETKKFKAFGQPVMSAHSLKNFIGEILGNVPTNERFEGTDAVSAYAITKGVDFLRVHNVKSTSRIVKVMDALVRGD